MKKEITKYLKYVAILAVLLLSVNCEKETNSIDENQTSQDIILDAPSPSLSQAAFKDYEFKLKESSKTRKGLATIEIDWENSYSTFFKPGVNILYTPIKETSSPKHKMFLASTTKNGELSFRFFTLLYNLEAKTDGFSGQIWVHKPSGELETIFLYEGGIFMGKAVFNKEKTNAAKTNCDSAMTVGEVIWLVQNLGIDEFERTIQLDCVVVTGENKQQQGEDDQFLNDQMMDDVWMDLHMDGPGGNHNENEDQLYDQENQGSWYESNPSPVKIINKLTGKAKCVYEKMENNSLLSKTLEKFQGKKTPVNLIIKQKSNLRENENDLNSRLVHGITEYGGNLNPNITIILNTEEANNNPSLLVAQTILHESIHAHIFRMIKTRGGMSLIKNKWTLRDGIKVNFPTLFDAYNEDPHNNQHTYMADYYRNAMVKGMKEFAKSIGKTYPEQLYKDLAWIGLLESKSWKRQYADPVYASKEKNRIIKSIVKFRNSETNDCK